MRRTARESTSSLEFWITSHSHSDPSSDPSERPELGEPALIHALTALKSYEDRRKGERGDELAFE